MRSARAKLNKLKIGLILIGAVVLCLGIYNTVLERRTAGWPSVPGTVTATGIRKQSSGFRTGKARMSYSPVVTYKYTVRGMEHESSKLSAYRVGGNESNAQRKIAQYPVGSKVTVYYDPRDPSLAVLVRGTSSVTYFVLALGMLFLAGAVGIHVALPRMLGDGEEPRSGR